MITIDFNRLDIPKGSRILDIGCGSGRHTADILQFEDIFVCGADLNQKDLSEAESRLCFHRNNGFINGGTWGLLSSDVTRLPFKSESYDSIICSEVLEHIHDDRKAISEIIRILKPGGNLVISVPRYWPEAICWLLSEPYRTSEGGHVRIYTKKILMDLLGKYDLKFTNCHHAHSIHAPFWILKCLIGLEKKSRLVDLYHNLLVWDMMKKPAITAFIDKLFNPIAGKSLVLYFVKKK